MAVDDRFPQARLRRRHERATFNVIRADAPISRTQLAQRTGLSLQAVGNIIRSLLSEGLIEETEMESQGGPGARPVGLRVRPDGGYALGFGLERDYLTGVVLELGGAVRWRYSAALPQGEQAPETLERIVSAVRTLRQQPEWSDCDFWGVGVATPGPIDLAEGRIVGPPNFPGWADVELVAQLEAALGLSVLIDNAASVAALGVDLQVPARRGSFLFCYWGVGIGGGLILDDQLYRGTTGNAIEIGHVVVDPWGHPCACGGVGCVEAEASIAALLRDAAALGSFETMDSLVAAADTPEIAGLLERAAERLAAALVSVVNLVDVDTVVLGGEHIHAVETVFLPVIRRRIEERAFRRGIAATRVEVTDLGEEVNAIGAAALVFDSLLARRPRSLPARARSTLNHRGVYGSEVGDEWRWPAGAGNRSRS